MPPAVFVHVLASSFLAGEQTPEKIKARVIQSFGQSWPWLGPLIRRYQRHIPGERPPLGKVVGFLKRDSIFQREWKKHGGPFSIASWLAEPLEMNPTSAARDWKIPAITSVGDLADWFNLSVSRLEWFADLKGLACRRVEEKLHHYHYQVLPKQSGNLRLIEAPKTLLKIMQRKILAEILEKVPAHVAAHGFVKRRSIKSFVSPHVGKRAVLRMDLQDFFPSIRRARVHAVFRTLGYPDAVSYFFAGLCTNTAPPYVWQSANGKKNQNIAWHIKTMYGQPHLPQGAPTSPSLANICFYRADCRLVGLERSAGATYSRYADDLAFSGDRDFEERGDRFAIHVAAILSEEGFSVHHRKTRLMRQGVRQYLAGIVANDRLNVVRPDFDLLKATLTNCVRFGSASQNRDENPQFRSHLDGRVQFVEDINPQKGQRLRQIYERVKWD